MKAMMTFDINQPLPDVRGLELLQVTRKKTKTSVMIRMDDPLTLDYLGPVTEDVRILGISGMTLDNLTLAAQGTKSFGWGIKRSTQAMASVGVILDTKMHWGSITGVVTIKPVIPLYGMDLPFLAELLARIVAHALAPPTVKRRPFSLYALEQFLGIVYDIRQGSTEYQGVRDWLALRELLMLEEAKERAERDLARVVQARKEHARKKIIEKSTKKGVTTKK